MSDSVSQCGRKGNSYLQKSIRKYGFYSFTLQQIGQFDATMLSVAEQLFIAELNTRAPNGYNLTDGGEGLVGYTPSAATRLKLSRSGKGRKRGPMSDAHKKALSLALTGAKRSPEFCSKRSEYMKLHSPTKGVGHSEATRKLLSEQRKQWWAERKSKCLPIHAN